LVLDEAIATPRSGHFIQNSSKLDYFYSLVAASPANHIENPVSSLWFVEYSNRLHEAIATPRSGHFIQNSSKLEYLLLLLIVIVLVVVLVLVLIVPVVLVFKRPVRFLYMLTAAVLASASAGTVPFYAYCIPAIVRQTVQISYDDSPCHSSLV
jgi:hypothetical protein